MLTQYYKTILYVGAAVRKTDMRQELTQFLYWQQASEFFAFQISATWNSICLIGMNSWTFKIERITRFREETLRIISKFRWHAFMPGLNSKTAQNPTCCCTVHVNLCLPASWHASYPLFPSCSWTRRRQRSCGSTGWSHWGRRDSWEVRSPKGHQTRGLRLFLGGRGGF